VDVNPGFFVNANRDPRFCSELLNEKTDGMKRNLESFEIPFVRYATCDFALNPLDPNPFECYGTYCRRAR
jgi:hypothetical protein